jgi:hypothetical protein
MNKSDVNNKCIVIVEAVPDAFPSLNFQSFDNNDSLIEYLSDFDIYGYEFDGIDVFSLQGDLNEKSDSEFIVRFVQL